MPLNDLCFCVHTHHPFPFRFGSQSLSSVHSCLQDLSSNRPFQRLTQSSLPSGPVPSSNHRRRQRPAAPLHVNDHHDAQLRRAVEDHFQALCADVIVNEPLTAPPLSPYDTLPSTWRKVLHVLAAASIVGTPLASLAASLGVRDLLSLCPYTLLRLLRRFVTATPIPAYMHMEYGHEENREYDQCILKLSIAQRTRLLLREPKILQELKANDIDALLLALQRFVLLPPRDIRKVVMRYPQILLVPVSKVTRILRFLSGPPLYFPPHRLTPLLRRAPWILGLNVDKRLGPSANWLDQHVHVRNTSQQQHRTLLCSIIAANPRIFAVRRAKLAAVRDFLHFFVGLHPFETTDIIRTFPAVLTYPIGDVSVSVAESIAAAAAAKNSSKSSSSSSRSSSGAITSASKRISRLVKPVRFNGFISNADSDEVLVALSEPGGSGGGRGSGHNGGNAGGTAQPGMADVVRSLALDIGLSRRHVCKIVHAFPALLTLDVDRDIRRVVNYLQQEAGIQNVARVVRRLPPILGYDVDTNIHPKMHYLLHEMKLPLLQVLLFPAVFSYSLSRRILPRTRFLMFLSIRVSAVGLSKAVSLSDDEFCKSVAKVPSRSYASFLDYVNDSTTVPVRTQSPDETVKRKKNNERTTAKKKKRGGNNAGDTTTYQRKATAVEDKKGKQKGGKDGVVTDDRNGVQKVGRENEVDSALAQKQEGDKLEESGGVEDNGSKEIATEDRVWGNHRFRSTLARIPWSDLG